MFRRFIIGVSLLVSTSAFATKESWYWGFALGPAVADLSGVGAMALSTGTKYGTAADIGFYWPGGEGANTIFGPAISGIYLSSTPAGDQSMLAFSVKHFFGKEPGDGLFLRGDVGIGMLRVSASALDTGKGFGFLAGAGYGIPLSEETRFLIEGGAHLVLTSAGNGWRFGITFGPMF